MTDALTSTYRRARQSVPDTWTDTELRNICTTCAVASLNTVIKWISLNRFGRDLEKVWAEEAQRLRNQLGACQDLAVLAGLHGPA